MAPKQLLEDGGEGKACLMGRRFKNVDLGNKKERQQGMMDLYPLMPNLSQQAASTKVVPHE